MKHTSWKRIGLTTAVIALVSAAGTRAQNLPDGFGLETMVAGPFIGYPVGFTFLPDGRTLIVEKETGNVRIAAVGAGTSVVATTIPGVAGDGERGLLGIAVDPAWPARPYIYLMATYTGGWMRVTMHTVAGDLTEPTSTNLSFVSTYMLLQIVDIFPNHKSGTVRFGPDGYLYVSVGDDGDVCAVMNVDAYNGKILRLDVAAMPGAGAGPPPLSNITPGSNPYFGSTDWARLVFAMGMRNPFRFNIDPLTNNLYIGDVGAHDWEEMDELIYAEHTGVNYGWPFYEASLFIARSCTPAEPYTDPIYAFQHQVQTPAAVIGGPICRGVPGSPVSFPPAYEGNVFLHDHYGGWIRRLQPTHGTWELGPTVPGQMDPENWAWGMGYISDLQMGLDGALYILVLLGVEGVEQGLHRIVNTIPVDAVVQTRPLGARAVPNPARVAHGVTIRLQQAPVEAMSVRIFDAAGRWVRTLHPGKTSRDLFWDGRSANGVMVAPGLYMYELQTHAGAELRGKISLVR